MKGHAGHPFNERCDKLAKRAADEGMQTAAANRGEETAAEEAVAEPVRPVPVAALRLEPGAGGEDIDFEAEDDGQLKLC
ncbi:MAG: hypothetical protein BA869_05335 [Desulfuromonadales bacterium C00003107]|nr:MAG: hypothetical protein BA869_05335 [Desulfuromonadales bacterium C00003107]